MRKIMFGFVVLAVMFAVGCEMPTGISDESGSSVATAAINFGEPSPNESAAARSMDGNGIKISFRSSDIEFWATDTFEDLQSHNFGPGTETFNVSTSIQLSDFEDNVVFMPNTVKISDYEMPDFDTSKIYNVARMDIGGGNINFTMSGNPVNASNSTLSNGSLDANSIVFIDEAVLAETVYVSRDKAAAIINDMLDDEAIAYDNYGIPTFVADFVASNTMVWDADWNNAISTDNTFMDVNGALFVPFEPVDFKNSNANRVRIRIDWDLDTVFEGVEGDEYILSTVADGTPYNFDVSVEIQ